MFDSSETSTMSKIKKPKEKSSDDNRKRIVPASGSRNNKANKRIKPHTKPLEEDDYSAGFVRGFTEEGYAGHDRLVREKQVIASAEPKQPDGPVEKNTSLLIKCGYPTELINLLPKDLIELHEPDICKLCHAILNGPNIGSAHYKSRGHFKKMKQWVTIDCEKLKKEPSADLMDILNSKKSTANWDILCELCGVSLTSKIQAELHIEGKLHQGIKEGRKLPRYPNTDIKAAEEKLMKQIEELEMGISQKPNVPVFTEPDNNVTESKVSVDRQITLNPSLYCEICDVIVNREDQLISHKNGKKHVSKEKSLLAAIKSSKSEEVANDPFLQ